MEDERGGEEAIREREGGSRRRGGQGKGYQTKKGTNCEPMMLLF